MHFLPYANAIYRMSPKLGSVDKTKQKLVAMTASLGGSKNKFHIDHLEHSSNNPANLANIGQVDFEIIGVKEIVKNK